MWILVLGHNWKYYFFNKPRCRNISFQPGQLRFEAEMMDLKQISSAWFITEWHRAPLHVLAASCSSASPCRSGELHHRHVGLGGLSLKLWHDSWYPLLSYLLDALEGWVCAPHTQVQCRYLLCPPGATWSSWTFVVLPESSENMLSHLRRGKVLERKFEINLHLATVVY